MAASELAFFGVFNNPYDNERERVKIQLRSQLAWLPDTQDFRSVSKQSKIAHIAESLEVQDLSHFLEALAFKEGKKRENGSIGRIDLLTHAIPEEVLLSGLITPLKAKSGYVLSYIERPWPQDKGKKLRTPEGARKAALTTDNLEYLETLTVAPNVKTDPIGISDIRKILKGAKLAIYACNAAVAKGGAGLSPFLKSLANALGIHTLGFRGAVKYKRKETKFVISLVDDNNFIPESQLVSDYRELDGFSAFVVPADPSS